jgi:Uma2 family endonuclease
MPAIDADSDQLLTVEEFSRLPDDEARRELVRRRIVREPPAGLEHGGLAAHVTSRSRSLRPRTRCPTCTIRCAIFWTWGTHLVWIIEPRRRTVMVYRSRDDIRRLTEEDELDGGDVLPRFRFPVRELFES